MTRATIVLAASVMAASLSAAQTPVQPPARDNAQPKTGTARIRGRVVAADTGQPLRKAVVRAFAAELREGRTATTDADGKYELKDLPAGRYTLSVTKGTYVPLAYGQTRPFEGGKPLEVLDAQTVEKVDFALPRGGVIAGRISDEFGEPVASVQVSSMRYVYVQGRRQLRQFGSVTTNDLGEYRLYGLAPSQYCVSATLRNFMAESEDRSGYAPTYFPGTTNGAEAERLTIGVGQTMNDVSFTLIPTRTARLSGTAVMGDGRPMRGSVVVMQREPGFFMTTGASPIKPDASFSISGVVPGEYTLRATGPQADGTLPEVAMLPISVNGQDLSDLRLVAAKWSIVSGRIVVAAGSADAVRSAKVRVSTMPTEEGTMFFGSNAGTVKDDLTFELKAPPGRYRLSAGPLPNGWSMKSVRASGSDVTDAGIDVRGSDEVSGIEIELTNVVTTLTGIVADSRGTALKDYAVAIFPQDREQWDKPRYTRSGRPDQDGRFKVTGLPPGQYYAVAVDYIEPGATGDPETLERLKARATAFSLNEGETRTLNLTLNSF